jgi:hypothetical protein
MIYAPGATSQSIDITIVDDTGLAVTGLVSATMPTIKYSLAGANADATITTSDLATLTTAYSSGGVKERGEGVYRLDLPNAALTTAGAVKIRGEATGKHVICEPITVGNLAADLQTIKTQVVTCAGGVTVPAATLASTTNITAGTITTTTNLTNAPTSGDFTATMKTSIGTAVAASAVASVTGNVGGNVTGSVATVTDLSAKFLSMIQLTSDTPGTASDYQFTRAAVETVWDVSTSGHTGTGSFGAAVVAAGSAGDPWATLLPGGYGAGTAGFIVGTNLNALITSRMATYTQPTGFLAATFPSGTVANTTNITAGTITTVTNLTNAPTTGDFTTAMKTSLNAATPASVQNVVAQTADVGARIPANLVMTAGKPWVLDGSGNAVATDSALSTLSTAVGSPMQAGTHVQLATSQDQYAPAKAGDAMALTSGERSSVATAWGSRDIGNGRTADYFLQGGFNKTTRTGSAFTVFSTDDATALCTAALAQDGTLDPIKSVDPA